MKIFTISNVPLQENQGSGYVILNFVQGLRERGHQVSMCGPLQYQPFPHSSGAHRLRLQMGYTRALDRAILSDEFDLVQAFGAQSWRSFSKHQDRRNRPLFLAHSNGVEPHMQEQLTQYKTWQGNRCTWLRPGYWFDRFQHIDHAFTCADCIITVSQWDRDYVVDRQLAEGHNVLAIENALPNEYLDIPLALNRSPIVGYCGSWSELKGAECLMKSIPQILNRYPVASVELIGTGPLKLTEMFPQHLCHRISHTEFLPRSELKKHYQRWAVALMPSQYESFGLVGAEAMACGAALVATKTGFPATLSNNQEAMIMESSQPEALTSLVGQLLSDDRKRRTIAKNGWLRVQRLRWKDSMDQFSRFIEPILDRHMHHIA